MNSRNWLIASLAVNVALLAVIVRRSAHSPAGETAASPPPAMTGDRGVPVPAAGSGRPPPPAVPPLDWPDSMAELRHAGVPAAIIAKVVVEKIAQKWTPLEAQLERQYLHDEITAARLAERHDERAQEEERELRAALGDGYRDWHREHIVQNMNLGGLRASEEQKEPLYVVETDWLKRINELEAAKRHGQLDQTAFDAAFARGEADYKGRLAAIIGHERVHGEPVENQPVTEVRRDFSRLQLTAAQTSALAAAQKQWSDMRGVMAESLLRTRTMNADYERDLQAIDRVRDDEYRRILGEEAYQTWRKAGDKP